MGRTKKKVEAHNIKRGSRKKSGREGGVKRRQQKNTQGKKDLGKVIIEKTWQTCRTKSRGGKKIRLGGGKKILKVSSRKETCRRKSENGRETSRTLSKS